MHAVEFDAFHHHLPTPAASFSGRRSLPDDRRTGPRSADLSDLGDVRTLTRHRAPHTALASTQSTHALHPPQLTRHMTGHEAQPARRPPRPGSGHHAVAPSRVAHIKYTELFTILYTLNSKAVRYALVTSSSTRTPSAVRCPRTWVTTFPPLPYVCMHSKCSSGLAPRKQSRKTRAQRASPLTHPAQ